MDSNDARRLTGLLAAIPLAGAAGYAAYAAHAYWRYGRTRRVSVTPSALDRFLPDAEVAERHSIRVPAPAAVTFQAVLASSLNDSAVGRAIFRMREFAMGAEHEAKPPARRALIEETRALGWVTIDEKAEREFTMGAVTRPWEANVVFRSIPAGEFAGFAEPGYVKIAWTIGVRPVDDRHCVVETETRAAATDAAASQRFRRYWALVSPGIRLIRRRLLASVRRDALRRRWAGTHGQDVRAIAAAAR